MSARRQLLADRINELGNQPRPLSEEDIDELIELCVKLQAIDLEECDTFGEGIKTCTFHSSRA